MTKKFSKPPTLYLKPWRGRLSLNKCFASISEVYRPIKEEHNCFRRTYRTGMTNEIQTTFFSKTRTETANEICLRVWSNGFCICISQPPSVVVGRFATVTARLTTDFGRRWRLVTLAKADTRTCWTRQLPISRYSYQSSLLLFRPSISMSMCNIRDKESRIRLCSAS